MFLSLSGNINIAATVSLALPCSDFCSRLEFSTLVNQPSKVDVSYSALKLGRHRIFTNLSSLFVGPYILQIERVVELEHASEPSIEYVSMSFRKWMISFFNCSTGSKCSMKLNGTLLLNCLNFLMVDH